MFLTVGILILSTFASGPLRIALLGLAGLAKAKPIAAILSAALMLDLLGEDSAAGRIRDACASLTDLSASTPAIGDAIASALLFLTHT